MGERTYFSLITMAMPPWQCLPCEQYSHMGFVLLIRMVNVGILDADAETGMKPEKMPTVLEKEDIGWHGSSKLDCTTEWFMLVNWNCTMSPTAAVMLLGVNIF
jgi:hypothetical protein